MRSHLLAVKALIAPLGYQVYIGDVPGAPLHPYVLLWASGGRLVSDEMCGRQDDLNDTFGVTMVATNADAALMMPGPIRGVLIGAQPALAGRHVQPLRLSHSEPVQTDQQVTLPGTNRHPAYVVDQYRLISEPA